MLPFEAALLKQDVGNFGNQFVQAEGLQQIKPLVG
jgi:hypothetical protein